MFSLISEIESKLNKRLEEWNDLVEKGVFENLLTKILENQNVEEVFEEVEKLLIGGYYHLSNDIMILKARFYHAKQLLEEKKISIEEYKIQENKVFDAISFFIAEINRELLLKKENQLHLLQEAEKQTIIFWIKYFFENDKLEEGLILLQSSLQKGMFTLLRDEIAFFLYRFETLKRNELAENSFTIFNSRERERLRFDLLLLCDDWRMTGSDEKVFASISKSHCKMTS